MRNTLAVAFLAVLLGYAGGVLAQAEQAEAVSAVLQEEAVAPQDLGVAEPTLLPSSPFYFFKNFARGLQRVFTFNPVRKLELELRFADEKIAEAQKLAEVNPERTQALERAIENYGTSAERLKARFEALRETSQNPKVEQLLEKLADRTVKHEKLFAELKQKFEAQPELVAKLEAAAGHIGETAAAAAEKDEPEKFARKLEKALVDIKGSDLKHVRSLEILDRIHEKADERLREKLADIRRDFAERLSEDLEAFVTERGVSAPAVLRQALGELPGDKARRLVILEELEARAEKGVGEALEDAEEALEKGLEKREELTRHAAEAIRHAEALLIKLEAAVKAVSTVPPAVEKLAREAQAHLERAKQALGDKKYGEAFGQARSAEVLARNALRILEHERPESEDLEEDISEFREKLNAWEARIAHVNPELQPKAREALEAARQRLALAGEALSQGQLREAKRHLEEAKEALRLLERVFHDLRKSEAKPAPAARPTEGSRQPEEERRREEKPRAVEPAPELRVVCTQEYDPICGVNGKTYSNACHARVAGVEVKYRGECGKPRGELKVEPAPIAQPPPPPAAIRPMPVLPPALEPIAFKIEADDTGFYPQNVIAVPKGARVHLTFAVRKENVYFGGLDFRSAKFKTEAVQPGGSTSVEFTADDNLLITSYWPASGVRKADLTIEAH